MTALLADQALRPVIAASYPMEQIGEAFEALNGSSPFGKITLTIGA